MSDDRATPVGKPLPPEIQKRMAEYDAQSKRLRFAISDSDLQVDRWHDIGAVYVKANLKQERMWIVGRPTEGAIFQFLALNPSVAFELANAILEQGAKLGWYAIDSVAGETVPRVRQ